MKKNIEAPVRWAPVIVVGEYTGAQIFWTNLTEDKRYTISAATEQILGLDDQVFLLLYT